MLAYGDSMGTASPSGPRDWVGLTIRRIKDTLPGRALEVYKQRFGGKMCYHIKDELAQRLAVIDPMYQGDTCLTRVYLMEREKHVVGQIRRPSMAYVMGSKDGLISRVTEPIGVNGVEAVYQWATAFLSSPPVYPLAREDKTLLTHDHDRFMAAGAAGEKLALYGQITYFTDADDGTPSAQVWLACISRGVPNELKITIPLAHLKGAKLGIGHYYIASHDDPVAYVMSAKEIWDYFELVDKQTALEEDRTKTAKAA